MELLSSIWIWNAFGFGVLIGGLVVHFMDKRVTDLQEELIGLLEERVSLYETQGSETP